jgi:hypothetical protein
MSDGDSAVTGSHPAPGFCHSLHGGHYRRGGLGLVKDASQKGVRKGARRKSGELWLAPAKPVLRILDKTGPLAKLAA